ATYRPAFAEQFKDKSLPDATDQPERASVRFNAAEWQSTKKMFESFPWVMAYLAPRGIGPTAWDQSAKKQVQHRRRFYLLGQTLEEMQCWDIRRAIQATRSVSGLSDTPLWLQGHRQMAALSVYAAIFEPNIKRIDLHEMPTSHRDGPALFNVLRVFDLPQAVALAAERSQVVIYSPEKTAWQFPQAVAE